ncbi:hypothetical protein WN943_028142 [Citrus x changshan-huyou]
MSCTFRPETELVQYSPSSRRLRNRIISAPRNSPSSSRSFDNWNLIFVAACWLSISLDGSFFYILYIDDYRKCLVLAKDLTFTLVVLRTVLDSFQIVYVYIRAHAHVPVPDFINGRGFHTSKWTFAKKFFCLLNGIVSVLPLPQAVIYLVIPKMRGHKFLSAMSLLKFVLVAQFLPRFVRMYQLFTKAASSSGAVHGLASGIFHFLVYLLVSHSFGALWYFLAIVRVSVCWRQACLHAGCSSHDSFYCDDDKFRDRRSLNAFCPAKLRDPTSFDFGMFHDALQSSIVEVTNFLQKFLYCFQWGIRSLSFAQNFQTSTDAWENIFSSAMTITGAVFIPFHLWNVMQFLQHINGNSERKIRKSSQMQEVEMWRLFHVLSDNLKQKIRKYCQSVFQGTEGFNLHQFFNDLPPELSFAMKHELCLPVLKEVPMLQRMDEQRMNAILDHFKLVPYAQGMFLVQEGIPVNKLQLIVGGDILSWSSTSVFTPRNDREFCGEELVSWAVDQQSDSSTVFPRSTRTVEAVTQVDAFSIEAGDLKEFVNQCRQPNGQLPKCFRYGSKKCRNWAAVIIQQAWCRQRKKKLQTSSLAVTPSRSRYSSLSAGELEVRREIVDPQQPHPWKFIWFMLCATAVSLDFWFFYIPVVNDDRKCISLDTKLAITACLLRFLFDFLYSIPIALQMLTDLVSTDYVSYGENDSYVTHTLRMIVDLVGGNNSRRNISHKRVCEYLSPSLLVDLLAIFPLPQVFGALWYFSAIERETECWKKACMNDTGCNRGSFDCDDCIGDYKFLDGVCPTKIRNTSIHDFGIFQDALQSGIVEVTDFPQKFLHCFRWGLRNLSCIGQNLQTSSNSWENFFVILVTICGLLLLLFLFGNMQMYLESKALKSKEMSVRMQEINEWMPIEKLSQSVQQQLKIYQRYVWRKPNNIDVESTLSSLPKELIRNIKHELCLELLKSVEEFKKLNEAILDALCDCVKMTFYFKHTHISLDGDPIYEMLFLVRGKIWIYSSKERINGSANTDYFRDNNNMTKMDHLADGDFWGEELVAWALYNRSLSNIPVSTRTVQTLTDVEGFVLTAEDLKSVFTEHEISGSTKLNLKHSNIQAACVIQLAWRRHRTRRKSSL